MKTRNKVDIDRPMSAANPQNRSCSVEVFIRWAPKLIANTIASGDSVTTQPMRLIPRPSGAISTWPA